MESKLETAQEAAIGFVRRLRPQDLAQVIDFDSRVQVMQGFTNSVADLEGAIRRTNAGRLDVAAQRDLHRAEGAEANAGARHRRHPAAGDRRAVGRRRHVEPRQLRRGAGAGEAIGDGDLRDRPPLPRRAEPRRSAKRSSCCASSRRRPAAACSSRAQISELASVYGQIADELSSQYTLGLHVAQSQARRRLAPHRRARGGAERVGAREAGLLRADLVIARRRR